MPIVYYLKIGNATQIYHKTYVSYCIKIRSRKYFFALDNVGVPLSNETQFSGG